MNYNKEERLVPVTDGARSLTTSKGEENHVESSGQTRIIEVRSGCRGVTGGRRIAGRLWRSREKKHAANGRSFGQGAERAGGHPAM